MTVARNASAKTKARTAALLACLIACAIPVAGARAQTSEPEVLGGTCDIYDFARHRLPDGTFDPGGRLSWSIRDDVQRYAGAEGDRAAGTLPFNRTVLVVEATADRAQLRDYDTEADLGWVDLGDLLCQHEPLRDPATRLEIKAFITTGTVFRGESQSVATYPNPELSGCGQAGQPGCVQLGRMESFFVYSETPESVLLSRDLLLEGGGDSDGSPLVGWVARSDVILWNTAVGLRPAADLRPPDGSEGEGAICAYATRELALAGDDAHCAAILGGERWFNLPLRMPVISEDEELFEVVIASSGLADPAQPGGGAGTFVINPPAPLEIGDNLRQVDVFFVVDGTRSMGPSIDQIRGTPSGNGDDGVIGAIRDALGHRLGKDEVTIRYGFRIYRDTIPGDARTGLGIGHVLEDTDCATMTQQQVAANHRAFQSALAQVRATDDPMRGYPDDYPENVFGALVQAYADSAGCDDNVKVYIVIGDAGYDAEAQVERGQPAVDPARIIARLQGPNVLTFFLRSPRDPANTTAEYGEAFDLFRTQATAIAEQVYAGRQGFDTIPTDRFVMDIARDGREEEQMLDTIAELVAELANTSVDRQIEFRIRGGQSLVEIIEELSRDEDMPVLRLALIEDSLCRNNEERCRESILETIETVFIPKDQLPGQDPFVEEILMSSIDLNKWRSLVQVFNPEMSGADKREELVDSMVRTLETILSHPEDPMRIGETAYEYLQRVGGLPIGSQSAFLSYHPGELENAEVVRTCEIEHLIQYATRLSDLLIRIGGGESEPLFETRAYPQDRCINMTATGRGVPVIVDPGATRHLPYGGFRTQAFGRTLYWIPRRYLP